MGRNVPKAAHGSSDATHETEVARLTRERDEALGQRVTTSEVLKVIRRSPKGVLSSANLSKRFWLSGWGPHNPEVLRGRDISRRGGAS